MTLERRIESAVARQFGLRPSDLHERTRRQPVSFARMLAMRLLRREHWGIREIGRFYGLDHSAVIQGIRRITELAEVDQPMRELCQAAERAL